GADQEGIGLTQGRGGLAIYPNPSTSDIQFSYSEGLPQNALTLTDLSGRVIQSWRDIPAAGFTIPRNGLKAGVYLVTYEDAEMKQTERIVFR
ncbi:MAG: T9SS type A sorting domain-containing protein, partial [Cyclobacteriaceae bacterium]